MTEMSASEVLAAVERLGERWGERADYLEQLAGYDTDPLSQLHKAHAKIIRSCVGELYREIEAANDRTEPRGQ